ncbi:MAG: FAD-dependent oxidoreductase [Proteobacteria bacterium]|nr:FAD-dependent oxidoreductase [Pseudomonadota bacterium]
MAVQPSAGVLILGGGPAALLSALQLHAAKVPATLVDPTWESAPPPLCAELAFMWGDESLPGLFHQSLGLWRSAPQRLGLPQLLEDSPYLDLATSPGREAKLREEATLDALGGESITYTTSLPPFLNAQKVRGVKSWPGGVRFAPGLLLTLRDAVAARGIAVHAARAQSLGVEKDGPVTLTLADGTALTGSHLLLASPAGARKLLEGTPYSLPLRPARGHVLTLPAPAGLALPLLVHRMARGHLFIVPQANSTVEVHYDALLDPLQATARATPDDQLPAALIQYLSALVPPLFAAPSPPTAAVCTHWLTPDFLPALGAWESCPQLLYAVGFAGREAAFAAAVANQLTQLVAGDAAATFLTDFAPHRFLSGHWKKQDKPGTLTWSEAAAATSAPSLTATPEYMNNVQTVATPEASYAGTVKQTEKTVVKPANKPEMRSRNSRPKIQTAGLKK